MPTWILFSYFQKLNRISCIARSPLAAVVRLGLTLSLAPFSNLACTTAPEIS